MTDGKNIISDIGGLSGPLTKLIETVSNGLGVLYEPTRIKRNAKAVAEAQFIITEGNLQQNELLKRAGYRIAYQEIHRQENIEKILEIASSALPESVSETPVERGWVSRFFDECKDVSKQDLQIIWGNIFAGEVAYPGSYSRNTLSTLKEFGAYEARKFYELCSLVWIENNEYYLIPVMGDDPQPIRKYGPSHADCLQLQGIGLLQVAGQLKTRLEGGDFLSYFDKKHILNFGNSNMSYVDIPIYLFTRAGKELFDVVNPKANMEFYSDCISQFGERECKLVLN